ncbi:hypothetical protein ACFQ0K_08655 [Nocardioides caeni]|uniref:Uncharacterized protein n=1 Tax=Nocardioides caeni TaxID=574700 RepID=A0A4S8N3B2_9ACTN|nr:hypothetical protein [Nocardioides caeni]THV10468.1 hypothetical protein E9934_14150 [Nocardioides caeni]
MTTVQTWTAQRRQTFGDWGNACMTALGTPLWPLHIQRCAECRAVQARWDRETETRVRGGA